MYYIKTDKMIVAAALIVGLAFVGNAALIAHYTFDTDGTATVGTDAALGDAASITSSAKVGAGALALSGAPSVDGSGDDGAVGGDSWSWSADTRTVAFWMKASKDDFGDTQATMISLGSGAGTGNRFDIRLNGNDLRLELQGGGYSTSSTVADGTWHHVAVVVPSDGATLGDVSYYIDGSLVGSMSGTTAIATGSGPLRMGDSYQDIGRDFKGSLDDVRLYNSALTGTEIENLAAIPEPVSLGLLGIFGVLFMIRRRIFRR